VKSVLAILLLAILSVNSNASVKVAAGSENPASTSVQTQNWPEPPGGGH
jgi:hypothetical protein